VFALTRWNAINFDVSRHRLMQTAVGRQRKYLESWIFTQCPAGTSSRLIADRWKCSVAGFMYLGLVNFVYRKGPNLFVYNLLWQVGD
jgi:hypothetical protein